MKTVTELALEAGFEEIATHKDGDSDWLCFTKELEKFAELVRADERNRTWTQDHWTAYECNIVAQERDACARVCDEWPNGRDDICLIATAIRARGEA
jgi:hypothetical protein